MRTKKHEQGLGATSTETGGPRGVPHDPSEARRNHLESVFWRKVLILGLRTIPPPIQRASMPLWSSFFYLQVPRIRRAIENNLSRLLGLSTPYLQAAAFRTFTNYCRCVANAYTLHAGAELYIPARLGVDAMERLTGSLTPTRGAILATGHLGNWHLGPYFLARHGLPPVTVVMGQEPNEGTQQLEAALRDQRMRVVYSDQSPMLTLELLAALRRGELVAFQMDRPTAGGGQRVPFGGGEATFALGPALLARTCEVPIVPVFFPMEGTNAVQILTQPPLWAERTRDRKGDMRRLTSELAQVYDGMVRRYPEQWFNFYDFWAS